LVFIEGFEEEFQDSLNEEDLYKTAGDLMIFTFIKDGNVS
jgi:hypothetical protein